MNGLTDNNVDMFARLWKEFRPMAEKSVLLAPSKLPKPEDLQYPMLASLKFDGLRMLVRPGDMLTRSMKPQPNLNLRSHLGELMQFLLSNRLVLDGELYSDEIDFSELSGLLRSTDQPIPDHVHFHVFDVLTVDEWERGEMPGFFDRVSFLNQLKLDRFPRVRTVEQRRVACADDVRAMYAEALEAGFEGVMLRSMRGKYKQGRATEKENIIFKQKPFDNHDAVVIGFEQQRAIRDDIERGVNELGRTKRTHRAEHFGLADNIGNLRLRDEKGREFNCGWGRGWTHAKRKELWDKKDSLLGRWVEFRCMGVGEKDLPRMPQLVRFRDDK